MAKQKRRGHGEGSIYQRKDGRWAASFYLESGQRKTLYGETRKEAYEKLQKALREQEQGTLVAGPQQTIRQYLEHWLEEVHKPAIRESSYVRYRRLLTNHILPILGKMQIRELTAQHVQALYARKLKEGLSPKTIKLIHTIIHQALKNAVRWRLVSRNVCEDVSLPRQSRHEIQPVTREQAQKLLETAKGHRLEAILTLALATGMRRGELLALRWRDIDFESRSLQIQRSVMHLPGGHRIHEPKTASGKRRITLPPFVVEALQHHRLRQLETKLKAGSAWEEHDLVFCNIYGRFLNSASLHHLFTSLVKKAGLPQMRFHDLRHSAATILMAMGVPVKVIQELLGHSSISITLNVYGHVLPSMQDEAMDKMERLFGKDEDESGKSGQG